MAEASCTVCQKSQAELSQSMKKCSRCQTTRYCSRTCQAANWPEHKKLCIKNPLIDTSEPPPGQVRSTVTWSKGARASEYPENETIYFLRTSTPHLDDISISGPYYPLENIVEQIVMNFHKVGSAGRWMIEDIVLNHILKLPRLIAIQSPLNIDPSKYMVIEIIPQHNPTIAAQLLRPEEPDRWPVYNLVSAELIIGQRKIQRDIQHGPSERPRVTDMEIHGCFATEYEAKLKMQSVATELARKLESPSVKRLSPGGDEEDDGDTIRYPELALMIVGLDRRTKEPRGINVIIEVESGKKSYSNSNSVEG